MNVLPYLGVMINFANGESMKLVGGDVSQSNVRLIRAVVVPGNKANFVEAALDIPWSKEKPLCLSLTQKP